MFPSWMAWPLALLFWAALPQKVREQLAEQAMQQIEADELERESIARFRRR